MIGSGVYMTRSGFAWVAVVVPPTARVTVQIWAVGPGTVFTTVTVMRSVSTTISNGTGACPMVPCGLPGNAVGVVVSTVIVPPLSDTKVPYGSGKIARAKDGGTRQARPGRKSGVPVSA